MSGDIYRAPHPIVPIGGLNGNSNLKYPPIFVRCSAIAKRSKRQCNRFAVINSDRCAMHQPKEKS